MTVKDLSLIPQSALDLDMLKKHLRLGSGFTTSDIEDDMLEAYARASVTAIEGRIEQALIERDFALMAEEWDTFQSRIFLAPISSVELVQIDHPDQSVTPQNVVFTPSVRGKLVLLSGSLDPLGRGDVAVIKVKAGIAASVEQLPADLRHAVLMLASHYYEHRLDTGLDGRCMPLGVSALLESYRPMRLGARV